VASHTKGVKQLHRECDKTVLLSVCFEISGGKEILAKTLSAAEFPLAFRNSCAKRKAVRSKSPMPLGRFRA